MTIAKLKELHNAYEWEQTRILAWIDDLNQHSFADNDKIPSAVVKRFYEIWIDYFKEIRASNEGVIEICKGAINSLDQEAASAAIIEINKTYHNKDLLEEIHGSSSKNRSKSRYFEAIDQGLNLELGAREYIEMYLTK